MQPHDKKLDNEHYCFLVGQEYQDAINNPPIHENNAEKLAWAFRLHRLEGAKRMCTWEENGDLEGEKMGYEIAKYIAKDIDIKEIK